MTKTIWLSVFAGAFFALWQLIMRKSGLNFVLAAYVLQLGSLIVFTAVLLTPLRDRLIQDKNLFAVNGQTVATAVIWGAILIGICAGLTNGVGQFAWQRVISLETIEIWRATMIMVVVLTMVSAVGGALFYGDRFTLKNMTGIGLALLGIYLLRS